MQRLIDIIDAKVREDIGDYYIVPKSRIENLVSGFEGAKKRIAELTEMIKEQQSEVERLCVLLLKEDK